MTDRSVIVSTFDLERSYPVAPAAAFAAWADPESKRQWFAPTADHYELDFRVGGREANRSEKLSFTSTYHDIVQDERIVYSSALYDGDRLTTVSLTTVQFFADGANTRLLLIEQGSFLDGQEEPAWREQGTANWLDDLARLLKSP